MLIVIAGAGNVGRAIARDLLMMIQQRLQVQRNLVQKLFLVMHVNLMLLMKQIFPRRK
jgi:saccharopine dehydrogenase-like NADP-dependent oxidoreductase